LLSGNTHVISFIIFQLLILTGVLINYKKLQKYSFNWLVPLSVLGFTLNVLVMQSTIKRIFTPDNTIELLTILFGCFTLSAIKAFKLQLLILICIIHLVVDTVLGYYSVNAWYNIHISNSYYLVISPLYYWFFFSIIRMNSIQKKSYISIACILIIIFFIDYFDNTDLKTKKNILSIIILKLSNVLLSGLAIIQVISGSEKMKIQYHPYFWLFAAFLQGELISAISDATHRYRVVSQEGVRSLYFLLPTLDYSKFFFEIFLLTSFFFCTRHAYLKKTKSDSLRY